MRPGLLESGINPLQGGLVFEESVAAGEQPSVAAWLIAFESDLDRL
jgi:hypothetical protein